MALGESLPLPKDWSQHVRGAVVRAIGLAHKSLTYARGWVANSPLTRVKLQGENDRLRSEVALLKRELGLLRGRLERVPSKNRPHYLPTERLAILELKAARCWNAAQTARRLLLVPATILSWLQRLDRDGEDAFIKTPEPVNRFPELVQHVVQSLRAQLPTMGKQRIADSLARAGLHLSVATVARMLKRTPKTPPKRPEPPKKRKEDVEPARTVTAKRPHHVWNIDFTPVSTALGFWVPWFPFTLPTLWPFSWQLLVVVDHFSRKILGIKVFRKEATTEELCAFLTETAKTRWHEAEVHRFRSGSAVWRGVPRVVQDERHQAALRRGRKARQHCGDRALYSVTQGRMLAANHCAVRA